MESKTNSPFDEIIRVKNSKKASKNPKKTHSSSIRERVRRLTHRPVSQVLYVAGQLRRLSRCGCYVG